MPSAISQLEHPRAVELTADAAWLVAESIGAGSFPWVLAITPAVADQREAPAILARLRTELIRTRVMSDAGRVNPAGASWTRTVCVPWVKRRALTSVSRLFKMALLALKISSRKTISPPVSIP